MNVYSAKISLFLSTNELILNYLYYLVVEGFLFCFVKFFVKFDYRNMQKQWGFGSMTLVGAMLHFLKRKRDRKNKKDMEKKGRENKTNKYEPW